MNEAFKLLFDQVTSGIVWMQRNGVVRYANKAAVQMTPGMLGQPMMDPVAERTVKAAGQDLMLVMNNVSQERWYSQALENLIGCWRRRTCCPTLTSTHRKVAPS